MPDTRQIVVRSFRGAQLVLSAVHPARGFCWSADRDAALKLLPADALKLARAAAVHWDADCAALDIEGVMVQPKEARKARIDALVSVKETADEDEMWNDCIGDDSECEAVPTWAPQLPV